MRELVCARWVTARIFTAREGGEQHCQVGNSALVREEIVNWLSCFYPSLRSAFRRDLTARGGGTAET
jgi:hypothetical protein